MTYRVEWPLNLMQILSTLIFIITTFFKKLKIQELLKENVKKTEKKFLPIRIKIFWKSFTSSERWGGSSLAPLHCTTKYMVTWNNVFQQKKSYFQFFLNSRVFVPQFFWWGFDLSGCLGGGFSPVAPPLVAPLSL